MFSFRLLLYRLSFSISNSCCACDEHYVDVWIQKNNELTWCRLFICQSCCLTYMVPTRLLPSYVTSLERLQVELVQLMLSRSHLLLFELHFHISFLIHAAYKRPCLLLTYLFQLVLLMQINWIFRHVQLVHATLFFAISTPASEYGCWCCLGKSLKKRLNDHGVQKQYVSQWRHLECKFGINQILWNLC